VHNPLREEELAAWLRDAIAGDAAAYRRFLQAVTPFLRAMARRRCESFGAPPSEAEDIVQEVLLAIHLKRGTWDPSRPLGPWLSTIVRNKMIDTMRRRGRQVVVPIEDVIETLEAEDQVGDLDHLDIERLLARLKEPQRDIVQSISVQGTSIRDTANRLKMTEGAVRVSLHRALKTLAALYRSDNS
jgi:RNA polymerase sigma factor (sigma-70 family)